MKKIAVITTAAIATATTAVILVKQFSGGTTATTTNTTLVQTTVVSCPQGYIPDANAVLFALPATTAPAIERKEISSLTPAELEKLRLGIKLMKDLNPSYTSGTPVKTSWKYYAAIHCLPKSEITYMNTIYTTPAAWVNSQHNSKFFLMWHRMYLYFFERILQKKLNDPNFRLPYWDYGGNKAIPISYREPTINVSAGSPLSPNGQKATIINPLYDASRANAYNKLKKPAKFSSIKSIKTAISESCFSQFAGKLMAGFHTDVHQSVSGNMKIDETSALDPLFFLHHAGIDRLWDEWMRQAGHFNPTTDASWNTQKFNFVDETGRAVTLTGSDIVNANTQLKYYYSYPGNNSSISYGTESVSCIPPSEFRTMGSQPGYTNFKGSQLNLSVAAFKTFSTDPLKGIVDVNTKLSPNQKVFIEFEKIIVNKYPEGSIAVYIVPKTNPIPKMPSEESFAGYLGLFGLEEQTNHLKKNYNLQIDISDALRKQSITLSSLKNATIVIKTEGGELDGVQIPTEADIVFNGINIYWAR
jgi:Common central domain of tyrosinase/Polyphenol oxidase middle domain